MHDIFEFIIQTLYAGEIGLFILLIKRIFRDKLPPVWQFSVWSILAAALILPYSFSGIIQFSVELIKTYLNAGYSVSRPRFFFPVPDFSFSGSLSDVIYIIYFSGFVIFIIRYIISYIRLKITVSGCEAISDNDNKKLKEIADKYKLKSCKAVVTKNISTPFVFGIARPVIVLPEEFPDEKIILHELLHLKYKDMIWGIFIAIFRSVHWCNPLLWYCFNKINNDIEELCDSRVLELIEGEERREYGNLLLAMADCKFTSGIGSSSIANGGRNIRSRIETIVRFNKYPKNNKLICFCITLILASFLLINAHASAIPEKLIRITNTASVDVALSAARSYYCTTPAAAIDTYAKAVLQNNAVYRAISAPLSFHKDIRSSLTGDIKSGNRPHWDTGIDSMPFSISEYYVYNLEQTGAYNYTAVLAIPLNFHDSDNINNKKIAYQKLNIYREDFRWVVTESSEFNYITTYKMQGVWGCDDLPAYIYRAEADDFTIERHYQLCYSIYSGVDIPEQPVLNAEFSIVYVNERSRCIYTGPEAYKPYITKMRLSCSTGSKVPDLFEKYFSDPSVSEKSEIVKKVKDALKEADNFSFSSSNGSSGGSTDLSGDWNNIQTFGGGGYTAEYKSEKYYLPEYVDATLYINSEVFARKKLERVN